MSCLEKLENSFYRLQLVKLMESLDTALESKDLMILRKPKKVQILKSAMQYLKGHRFNAEEYPEYPAKCCFMLLHICFALRHNDAQLVSDIILYFIRYAENSDALFCFMDGVSFPYDMDEDTVEAKVTYLLEMAEKGHLEFKGQRMADFLIFQYVLTRYKKLTNRRLAYFLNFGTRELLTPCAPCTDGTEFWSSNCLLEVLRYMLWNMNFTETNGDRKYDADCVRLILRALWMCPRHVTKGLAIPPEFEDIHDVPKLKHLARCAVRRSLYLGWNLRHGLTKLPFGKYLMNYLTLMD